MTRARNSTVRSRENQDPDGYGSYVVRAGSSHGESGFVGGGRDLKIGGVGSPVKPEKERPPRLEGNGGPNVSPVSAPRRARAGRRGVSLGKRFAPLAGVQLELAQEHVELDGVQLASAPLRSPQLLLDPHEAIIGVLAHDLAHEVVIGKHRLAAL